MKRSNFYELYSNAPAAPEKRSLPETTCDELQRNRQMPERLSTDGEEEVSAWGDIPFIDFLCS